ncbi:hypothetical protein ACSBR1_040597 [Camellia fascicularis]
MEVKVGLYKTIGRMYRNIETSVKVYVIWTRVRMLVRTLPLKEFKRYMLDYIPRERNQAANFLATRARDWMLRPTSKTTVEICHVFDTVRDCCKDDLAEHTYLRDPCRTCGDYWGTCRFMQC